MKYKTWTSVVIGSPSFVAGGRLIRLREVYVTVDGQRHVPSPLRPARPEGTPSMALADVAGSKVELWGKRLFVNDVEYVRAPTWRSRLAGWIRRHGHRA